MQSVLTMGGYGIQSSLVAPARVPNVFAGSASVGRFG
ncbi:hypothetical protein ACVWZ8_004142 [Arthrobacter sp. UYCu723]